MRFCPYCGAETAAEGARFCSGCGKELPVQTEKEKDREGAGMQERPEQSGRPGIPDRAASSGTDDYDLRTILPARRISWHLMHP